MHTDSRLPFNFGHYLCQFFRGVKLDTGCRTARYDLTHEPCQNIFRANFDKDLDTAICLAGVWAHAWEVTGLSAAQCGDLSERIESQVDSVTQLMFPAGESGVA